MGKAEEPAFYDDLAAAEAEAWRCLAAGASDRRSGFHHLTAATSGLDGRPRARTVVLRAAERQARRLAFHTDLRAAKVRELQRDPRICLQAFDPARKIQLRAEGTAVLAAGDDAARRVWGEAQLKSRVCYGIEPAPGMPVEAGDGYTMPEATAEATASGFTNFVVVSVFVAVLDFYYLSSSGHRRASFTYTDSKPDAFGQWHAP